MIDNVAQPQFILPAGENFLLLSPTAQAHAYRNVDKMFTTRTIRRGRTTKPLSRGAEINPRYEIGDITYPGNGWEQPEPAQLHPCQDQPEDQPAAKTQSGGLKGHYDALDHVRHAEVVEKQLHGSGPLLIERRDLLDDQFAGLHLVRRIKLPLLEKRKLVARLVDLGQCRFHSLAKLGLVLRHCDADVIG